MNAVVVAFAIALGCFTVAAVLIDRADARRHRDVYAGIAAREALVRAMTRDGDR